jgi:glycosyltransferase involved in cell wall biosynthesis
MNHQRTDTIAYVLKRYPRLSETFILNEVRALERLGTRLHIFSLMQAEGSLTHPTVQEVSAPVTYLPARWLAAAFAVVKAHGEMAVRYPVRYLHAVLLAVLWSFRSRRPISVWKQFMRAGYVAQGCRRNNIRHIHAHFANAPATVARLASVLCAIPYSFTTHAKDLYLTPQKVLRRRIRSAKFVLTCTGYNLQYLRSFARKEDLNKIHLIYHGIDLAEFVSQTEPEQPAGDVDQSAPLILSVGRLVPKKGMTDLLFALDLLVRRGIKFRSIIVGEGPLRAQLETQINELQLNHHVQLPGAMAHDRLVGLFEQAHIFALSPRVTEDGDRDGIPNVLAEAMASRVPVVTTSVSGIPELIEDGRTGLLVGSENPEALANAIERLLRDEKLRQKLAESGRKKIESGFECWETAKALHQLYTPLPEAI